MKTICTIWDDTQLPPETEWRMWSQMRGAYGIDRFVSTPNMREFVGVNTIFQYSSMSEALASTTGARVFLEPTGTDVLADIPAGDIVLIFGNTLQSNSGLIQTRDLSVKIPSVNPSDLYGVNAAAIVLAYLYGL